MSKSKDMSFLDHLEELRWHLIRSVISILIFGFIAFLAKEIIFDIIIFGPKKGDFISYKLFCSISQSFGGDAFCFNELPFRVQSRTVSGQFSAHLWTSILAGFIIAFPYIIWEFWKFISPGMYKNEKDGAKGFIFISSLLFFIGVLFGYYIVTPLSINFLGSYTVSNEVFNDFDLAKTIRELAIHGMPKRYFHTNIGYNSRLDSLQAAILNVKLIRLNKWIEQEKQ